MEKDSYNTWTLSQGPHYNKIWKSYSNRDNRLGGVADVTDHSTERIFFPSYIAGTIKISLHWLTAHLLSFTGLYSQSIAGLQPD